MSMNKQTVWLVTMLTLMVALSAYYIVTGPVEPVQQTNKKIDEMLENAKMDVKMEELGQNKEKQVSQQVPRSDFFVNYHLQRDTLRSKLTEDYMRTLSDPNASAKSLNEAEKQVNRLMKVDQQESSIEEQIRKEGYHDVVVMNNQTKVDVVVQSGKLSKLEAVHLISLVGKHFRIDPTDVSISYRN